MEQKQKIQYSSVDYSRLPLVLIKVQSFDPTPEEFEAHLLRLSQSISNPGVVLIIDLSKARFLSSELRIAAGHWIKKETPRFRQNVKGVAFANNSLLAGVILKGIFLISKLPVDYIVCNSVDEAIKWASGKL